MGPYITFSEDEVTRAIQEAADKVAADLKANHKWKNRTGAMERSIGTTHTGDEVSLEIAIDYAGAVDYRMPFVEELEGECETEVELYINQYVNDANKG